MTSINAIRFNRHQGSVIVRCREQGVQPGQTIPLEVPGLVRQDVNGIVPPTAAD